MAITAQECELLSFFEVEPQLTDTGVPWSYNEAIYDARAGRFKVLFKIRPAESDIAVTVNDGDNVVFELVAKGIHNMCYRKERGVETLEMLIRHKHEIHLAIRPSLSITERVDRYA